MDAGAGRAGVSAVLADVELFPHTTSGRAFATRPWSGFRTRADRGPAAAPGPVPIWGPDWDHDERAQLQVESSDIAGLCQVFLGS